MEINLVWYKKDLRLEDHKPLREAIEEGRPLLMLHVFGPTIISAPYSDLRHFRFIKESIDELNKHLKPYRQRIYCLYGEVIDILKELLQHYEIKRVFSHQETGTWLTFQRDLEVKKFLKERNIERKEFQNFAVIRFPSVSALLSLRL